MNTTEAAPSLAQPAQADLATYLQRMRDHERSELAREIHDELGSLLTGAKLEIASLRLRLEGTSGDAVERLTHLAATIDTLLEFSRRVVDGLHPSSLTNLGLRASLEILVNDFRQSTGIAATADLDQADFDYETQLTAYRMVQEALNNASKHAHATEVQVVLRNRGADALLSVRDNGNGFDTAALGMSGHGLAGMRHRIAAGGGRLTMESAPGHGTLLVATLRSRDGADRRSTPAVEWMAQPTACQREVSTFELIADTSVDYLNRLLASRDEAATHPVCRAGAFAILMQAPVPGSPGPLAQTGSTGPAARASCLAADGRNSSRVRRKSASTTARHVARESAASVNDLAADQR